MFLLALLIVTGLSRLQVKVGTHGDILTRYNTSPPLKLAQGTCLNDRSVTYSEEARTRPR
jgi:hypothetical protein